MITLFSPCFTWSLGQAVLGGGGGEKGYQDLVKYCHTSRSDECKNSSEYNRNVSLVDFHHLMINALYFHQNCNFISTFYTYNSRLFCIVFYYCIAVSLILSIVEYLLAPTAINAHAYDNIIRFDQPNVITEHAHELKKQKIVRI